MLRYTMLVVALLVLIDAQNARGQDSEEVKRLKKEVELLERELKLVRAENEQLKKENDKLKQGKPNEPAKPAADKDAFAKDAVFTGKRTIGKDIHQELNLVVTKRDGTSFEGEITITHKESDQTLTAKVTGTAAVGNGNVKFTTEKSGKFQQSFTGKFNNGEFGFECGGTSRDGTPVSGKGYIRVK